MKILIACTPATGHLNPLLAITSFLRTANHEIAFLTGSTFRDRVESSGATFVSLPEGADFDLRNILSVAPELAHIPTWHERWRFGLERFFIDPIPAQHRGLLQALQDHPADLIMGDGAYLGVLPMLLGSRANRPPIALCGTSILPMRRADGLPNLFGLPPASTGEQRQQYAAMAREADEVVDQPLLLSLNRVLGDHGVGPVSMPLFELAVEFADVYLQLSVPSFEFPRQLPSRVHFVGTPPIIPAQVPPPSWAHELDGSRKVVLVTQGTVDNDNLGLLVAPTLSALAGEPGVLVVATTGGRSVEAIPGAIPSNVRLASYLPFEWLLPKVDALVTNGGYGGVSQAMSFGVPLVTAGRTADKADVGARVAWSGVGIDLATNKPTQDALRRAVRTVLDQPTYRLRASQMAKEFAAIDTRSKILSIIDQVVTEYNATPRRAMPESG